MHYLGVMWIVQDVFAGMHTNVLAAVKQWYQKSNGPDPILLFWFQVLAPTVRLFTVLWSCTFPLAPLAAKQRNC